MDFILRELRKPYGPLIPWAGLVLALLVISWLIRFLALESTEHKLAVLEAEWREARSDYQFHLEAQQAKKDLTTVWSALPEERDFAPLALGITEEAKRNHVTLPALSYKTDATPVAQISRGTLQGTMTGKYEDLRRFLYEVETAEELVYIEDLDLVRSGERKDGTLTFNIKIAAYLRTGGSVSAP